MGVAVRLYRKLKVIISDIPFTLELLPVHCPLLLFALRKNKRNATVQGNNINFNKIKPHLPPAQHLMVEVALGYIDQQSGLFLWH